MALPSSGNISLSQVNTELTLSATAQISLNDTAVRTLASKSSGQIAMSDLYGTSSVFNFTISSNQLNANLRTLAVAAGWNQTSTVNATIGAGETLTWYTASTGGTTTTQPSATAAGTITAYALAKNNTSCQQEKS